MLKIILAAALLLASAGASAVNLDEAYQYTVQDQVSVYQTADGRTIMHASSPESRCIQQATMLVRLMSAELGRYDFPAFRDRLSWSDDERYFRRGDTPADKYYLLGRWCDLSDKDKETSIRERIEQHGLTPES